MVNSLLISLSGWSVSYSSLLGPSQVNASEKKTGVVENPRSSTTPAYSSTDHLELPGLPFVMSSDKFGPFPGADGWLSHVALPQNTRHGKAAEIEKQVNLC